MMTQEELIEMARKSDFEIHPDNLITWDGIECTSELIAFAKLVAEKAIKEALEKSVECMCGICKLGHQRTWVGLTQEERLHFLNEILDYGTGFVSPLDAVICNIETKLKDKNTRGQE